MTKLESRISRRSLFSKLAAAVSAAPVALSCDFALATPGDTRNCNQGVEGEILGQGEFRYRANAFWGRVDRSKYPVRDCHGISEDRDGRIVTLTNDIRNNLIAYDKSGRFVKAWEHRFPGAHALDIVVRQKIDQYWITDQVSQSVSVLTTDGAELLHVGPEALAKKYPEIKKYKPTNTAVLADGDFFVSDGYGSSFVHHFDPQGNYISSFGGEGDAPENLKGPHAIWIDNRPAKQPTLLVCDRDHNMLKWFSVGGELLRVIELGETMRDAEPTSGFPCNVAGFGDGPLKDHLAIACVSGMILILDGSDRIVSVVGGMPPVYVQGKLQSLQAFNYTLNHPHDVHVDAAGDIYVSQWWSNQTYPIKLELLNRAA